MGLAKQQLCNLRELLLDRRLEGKRPLEINCNQDFKWMGRLGGAISAVHAIVSASPVKEVTEKNVADTSKSIQN